MADSEPPDWIDWDLWLAAALLPHTDVTNLRTSGGSWKLAAGRSATAAHISSAPFCGAFDAGITLQTSFTVEAKGKAPSQGLWDCPVDMEVTYQFRNPDWTLEWGQPGNKVGKTEFGNVFWGEQGQLILEWEGGYRPANPEAANFQLTPGGKEVYRTDEYEDFNMNHKADWFKSIREGHLRPAVDIEIGHRTATLCKLGNLSYIWGENWFRR